MRQSKQGPEHDSARKEKESKGEMKNAREKDHHGTNGQPCINQESQAQKA